MMFMHSLRTTDFLEPMAIRPHLTVRITHAPTGESITLPAAKPGDIASSLRELGVRAIRARLAALRFGQPSGRVVATYRLPDCDPYPDNLRTYCDESAA